MNNVVAFSQPRQQVLACKNDSRKWMFNICTENTFQDVFVEYYNPGCKFSDLDEDSLQVYQTIVDDGCVTFEGDEGMYLLKDMESVIQFFDDRADEQEDEIEYANNRWQEERSEHEAWKKRYSILQKALKTALGDNAIQYQSEPSDSEVSND